MNKAEKRHLFFRETLKLIHEKGFKAMTMRDIAERMNFEVANVYNYIDSKQSLLENYLFDIADKFNEGLTDIMESSHSIKDKLNKIVSLHCHLPAKNPFQIGLLLSEWRNLKGEKMLAYLKSKKWYEEQINNLISAGIEDGIVRKCDPYITTQSMLSAFHWIHSEYTNAMNKINPVEMEKQMSMFILGGLLIESK